VVLWQQWTVMAESGKRTFDEMAAADLARVFFQTVSKKVIVDAMPKVHRQQQIINYLESKVAFYENICPPCVTNQKDCQVEYLYCDDCDQPLSCMDWKNNQQLTNCDLHPEPTPCSDCDVKMCPDCVHTCVLGMEEFCYTCLHYHAQTCQPCRLEGIM